MGDLVHTDYPGDGLTEGDLATTPLEQVGRWLADAEARQAERGDVPEPTALSVATVDAAGIPNVRTVLLRFLDARGPGFVSDLGSAKGAEIAATGGLAAALTWPAMYRAVRFRGRAVLLDRDEVADYFVARPWGSRISAWASDQSRVIEGRSGLEAAYQRYAARWPDRGGPTDVPLPDFWGGYRITCDEVEFWAGRSNRLHDRLVFIRVSDGALDDPDAWRLERRQP